MEDVRGWILNDDIIIATILHLFLSVTTSHSKWEGPEIGKNLFGGLLVNGVGSIAMNVAHDVAKGSITKIDPNSCILREKQKASQPSTTQHTFFWR